MWTWVWINRGHGERKAWNWQRAGQTISVNRGLLSPEAARLWVPWDILCSRNPFPITLKLLCSDSFYCKWKIHRLKQWSLSFFLISEVTDDQTMICGKQYFLFLKSVLIIDLNIINLGSGALFSGLEGWKDFSVHQGLKWAVIVHHYLLFFTKCRKQERAKCGQLEWRTIKLSWAPVQSEPAPRCPW